MSLLHLMLIHDIAQRLGSCDDVAGQSCEEDIARRFCRFQPANKGAVFLPPRIHARTDGLRRSKLRAG